MSEARYTDPLNLLSLAKAQPGTPQSALFADLMVLALGEPLERSPFSGWLLVLEGTLILDLPHGDFRTLKTGESLELRADKVTLTPLEGVVLLYAEA